MKTSKIRTRKVYTARESATITCVLAKTQRQQEEWERFIVEKGEGFRFALTGDC